MSAAGNLHAAILEFVSNKRRRRLGYALLALISAFLSIWPKPYVARARLMPQDTASAAGTTALMTLIAGQSQNVASLLGGGRASNDLYLIIGRSDAVERRVIRELKLVGPNGYNTENRAKRALEHKVVVTLLLGGVMEIETKSWDAAESKKITTAYVDAVSKELASFGEQIIVNKQRIIQRRFATAGRRVDEAAAALNAFRRSNNLAAPEQQLGTELALRTGLQAQLQAKQIELKAMQETRGPENLELQSLQAQIAALQGQIARSAAPNTNTAGPNLAASGELTTHYLALYRDYRLAQAIYEIYSRSQEQVAVDQLAAESASYVQIIDPPYIDPDRQFNVWALAGLAAILLLAIFTEVYGPYTGLFDIGRSRPVTQSVEHTT